jgi:hypothetical protein
MTEHIHMLLGATILLSRDKISQLNSKQVLSPYSALTFGKWLRFCTVAICTLGCSLAKAGSSWSRYSLHHVNFENQNWLLIQQGRVLLSVSLLSCCFCCRERAATAMTAAAAATAVLSPHAPRAAHAIAVLEG